MKYNRFEELPVWKAAIELAVRVFALTTRSEFKIYASLRNQLERAAVSISNNIAEGFERGTTPELLTFIYISRGSAGETRSMLCLLEQLPGITNLKSEISNLKSKAEEISRQLRAWADSLQNSDVRAALLDEQNKALVERSSRARRVPERARANSQSQSISNCSTF